MTPVFESIIDLKPGDLFKLIGVNGSQEHITGLCVSKHQVENRYHCRVLMKIDASFDGQAPLHLKLLVFDYGPVVNVTHKAWHYRKVYVDYETHWRNYSSYECVELNVTKLKQS